MPDKNAKQNKKDNKGESLRCKKEVVELKEPDLEDSKDFGGIPEEVNFKRNMGCGG